MAQLIYRYLKTHYFTQEIKIVHVILRFHDDKFLFSGEQSFFFG
jgi:hypothetical protein